MQQMANKSLFTTVATGDTDTLLTGSGIIYNMILLPQTTGSIPGTYHLNDVDGNRFATVIATDDIGQPFYLNIPFIMENGLQIANPASAPVRVTVLYGSDGA